jgi:integrase
MKKGLVEQRHGRACTGTKRCACPWSFRVDATESVGAERRQIRRGGFATKTAAAEALRELQRRITNGEQIGGGLTVGAYLEEWIVSKGTAGRRASTLAQYRLYLDNYLKPSIGHVKLAELRASHLDAMLRTMEAEGRGLPTRHRVLAALSSALSTAERRRLISSNVCRQVDIAPERTPLRPIYDVPKLSRFLEVVASDRLAALWRLYGVLGLRRGEALALSWPMVDLEGGTLRVERSLGVVDGRLTFGPPKSGSGLRTVALDAETIRILRSHRAAQNAEKLALGAGYVDGGLVFAHEDGSPLRPEWVSKRFLVISEAAALPRIRLHDLRHSAASAALSAGVPMKVVSERLGHSSMGITADIYSHVTSELARDSAERVAAVLCARPGNGARLGSRGVPHGVT